MAEESVHLPSTPNELTKPKGVILRRNSTGKASSGNSEEKILPHYLRASTGSCHDFCKYGRKHAFEQKEAQPFLKRATKKPHNCQNYEERFLPTAIKKTPPIDIKTSLDLKSHMPDTTTDDKKEVPTKSPGSQKQLEREVSEKKRSLAKGIPPLISDTSESRKNLKQEKVSTSEKMGFISKQPSLRAKEMKLSAKFVNALKSHSSMLKSRPSFGSSTSFSAQVNGDNKMGKRIATSKVAVKDVQKPSRVSLSPNKRYLDRTPSLNSRKLKGVKVLSHLKSKVKTRNDEAIQNNNNEVQEKTLYVIKMDSENRSVETDQNVSQAQAIELSLPQPSSPCKSLPSISQSFSSHEKDEEESQYTSDAEDGYFSDKLDFGQAENAKPLEEKSGHWLVNHGMDCSGDQDCQSQKLKFRSGKMVGTDSENKGSGILKFRRGKMLENLNAKDDAKTRIFKQRDGDETVGVDTVPSSEKVVLKHQDVQDKKDAQGLLNNIIEETASKLVETRKSKVKALVGAFETVISLQETKP